VEHQAGGSGVPGVSAMRTFKGLTHVHSKYSFDGKLSLQEIKTLFTDAGYDFALMSEHIEGMSSSNFECFVEQCVELSDDHFVFVPGLEFHSECLATNGLYAPLRFNRNRRRLLHECLEQPSFNVLLHPCVLKRPAIDEVRRRVHSVEVWNAKYDGARYPSLQAIHTWRLLNRERMVSAVFGVDFHERRGLFPMYVRVQLQRLSHDVLLDALREGRFSVCHRGKQVDLNNVPLETLVGIYGYSALRWCAGRIYRAGKKGIPEGISRRLRAWINGGHRE